MTATLTAASADVIPTMRRHAREIFQAGIDAADPYKAIKRCLFARANHLEILLDINHPSKKRPGRWSAVHLVAFGKAACRMAKAAQEVIPEKLIAGKGIAVTNYENLTPVDNFEVIGAGHPLPDQAGFQGAKIIAERVQKAQKDELVLALVSGGGSALIPYPADRISLDEKIAATELLLSCGAGIDQINCVRKHLSRLKGGGLAKLAAPADLHALILSDVLGDDVSAIASGPTVPDTTSFQQAAAVFLSNGIWDKVPQRVREFLQMGVQGNIPETPKPGDSIFKRSGYTLVGSNAISVNAVMKAADNYGYHVQLYSDQLCGEAREQAEKLVLYVQQKIAQGIRRPLAIISGGETTVTLQGNGRGGRNQEMALAFAIAAKKYHLPDCWTFLSGGTDGRDGPTDAAGGIVDPNSVNRMIAANADPEQLLENNDSNAALQLSKDLLVTGATGTNVADLQVLLIHSQN